MRVLTIGNMYPPHSQGGYERAWAAVVGALRGRGHDVVVLTTDHREPGVDAPDPPGVRRELRWYWRDHVFLATGPLASWGIERHDRRVFDAATADVVACFSMGGLPLSLVGRGPAPAVAVVHDGWPVYGPRVDRWHRLTRRAWRPGRVAHWSFNSEYSRTLLARAGLAVDPARTSVEPPGIDPAAFPAREPREWAGRLLVLGRVEPRKGVATAIAALPDGCTLDVVGPAEPAYGEGLAAEAGPSVRFAGPTEDPAGAIAAADAVLFPVEWEEPWGLVPLEAMAVGRPVVATGTGGSAEYLRDGENCLLARGPEDTRAAVERLRDDPALRARLVAGGRATAARHTEAAFAAAVADRIEETAGRAGRPPTL